MEKKKILVVSSAFYPEISPRSFRATELVKELCRQGHHVTVLTAKKPEHENLIKEFGFNLVDFGQIKLFPTGKKGIYGRILLYTSRILQILTEFPEIQFMFKIRKAIKKLSGFDLMISVAVPHPVHWGVALVHSKKHPVANFWIADCGDPFMGNKMDTFRKPFYFAYFEKLFCKKADKISVPILVMKENYYSEFHNKFIEIPQGFRFEDVKRKQTALPNKVPTFGFAGTFISTTRNPTQILDYLVKRGKPFRFVVFTQTPDILEPYREKLGAQLEIRSYIPRLELLYELSGMDFLINIGYDPVNQAPSKLIDYYLTGRPTLSVQSGELIEENFEAFLNGDYSSAFSYSGFERYNISSVTARFLSYAL